MAEVRVRQARDRLSGPEEPTEGGCRTALRDVPDAGEEHAPVIVLER